MWAGMEQHTRVELASSVWKTDVLPLHQCCGMLPVLHGCGSVLDRNPEPGFPARSTGGFRRAPALTWADAFLKREEIHYAAARYAQTRSMGMGFGIEPKRWGDKAPTRTCSHRGPGICPEIGIQSALYGSSVSRASVHMLYASVFSTLSPGLGPAAGERRKNCRRGPPDV